jgi:hypothetical protein
MNEAHYWRQRYEMLMATFAETVKSAIDASTSPRLLADKNAYELGRLHGAAAEREACAQVSEDWDSDMADPRDIAAAIRARGEKT